MPRRALLVLVGLAAAVLAVPPLASADRPRTWNTRLVGHLNPGGGFTGDVWVHRNAAYLGSWGIRGHCPVHGVRAINVRYPSQPRLKARFARYPGTTSEDVWVGRVATPSFTGDLAAVGIQRCGFGRKGFRGLALFDVTTPARPRALGRFHTGTRSRGVHELSVTIRADGRVLALLAVPHSWHEGAGAQPDVRVVDVADPRNPQEVGGWDFRRDGPEPARSFLRNTRGDGQLLAHSVWPFDGGRKAFVSHWDAGAVFLDLADPSAPQLIGRTAYGSGASGNAHSGWFRPDEQVFVQNDEVGDFFHTGAERRWGFQRIYDVSDLASPVEVGRFRTRNARPRNGRYRRDGIYSVHNNVFVGNVQVVSWYSDGVRIVNVANPARPREIGYFVPPPRRDPQGYVRAPNGKRKIPYVWGVFPRGRLVYASDKNSGLWIFRARGLPLPRGR